MDEVSVPRSAFDSLKAGAVAGFAANALGMHPEHEPGRLWHPGDSFGRVLAWLWNTDPDMAMLFLADYMAELHLHSPVAHAGKPVPFADVLNGLRLALPPEAEDSFDAIVDRAREQVPKFYANVYRGGEFA